MSPASGTPSPGIEPRPHWWEASALTTASSLVPECLVCLPMSLCRFCFQLTALAMLLLDPYFRTIEGFEVIIKCIFVVYVSNPWLILIGISRLVYSGSYRKGVDQFWAQISAGKNKERLLTMGGDKITQERVTLNYFY